LIAESPVTPDAVTVKRAEGEVWRPLSLPTDEFRAAAHVVLHPRGYEQVVRVPLHLAHVEGQRRHEIADVRRSGFDHQVRVGHRAPEFRLDGLAVEVARLQCKRVSEQMVRADVRAVPIRCMREEHHSGRVAGDDVRDDLDGLTPPRRIAVPSLHVDALESAWSRAHEIESQVVARVGQFLPPRLLARLVAPLRHRDVDDTHAGLALEAQRHSADDALIVWVRREDQDRRGVRSWRRSRRHRESAERKFAPLALEPLELRHKAMVRRRHRVIAGRLAAAIAWPWRLSCSFGT
jgi:hypothetical protein